MPTTNLYCTLTFHSDTEKFDLMDFEHKIQIDKNRSWTMGDLQHPDYKESARMDSAVVIKSNHSHSYDGTETISSFFHYLSLKKDEILYLKQQYNASLYFDIVINVESEDSPVVFLSQEHITYLNDIGASLHYAIYDYR